MEGSVLRVVWSFSYARLAFVHDLRDLLLTTECWITGPTVASGLKQIFFFFTTDVRVLLMAVQCRENMAEPNGETTRPRVRNKLRTATRTILLSGHNLC